MTELGLAILGSGYMGRTYAECISKYNTRARLAAVAGGSRAPGLAADYGVAYEPTYAGLLARPDVDAVLVATPHADHRNQVIAAAEAGKHVLVEKPMATSVADCDAMIAACRSAGVVLEVIQTLRFRGTAHRRGAYDPRPVAVPRLRDRRGSVARAARAWRRVPRHGRA